MGGGSSKAEKMERKASKRRTKRETKKEKKSKMAAPDEGVVKPSQTPPPATPTGSLMTYEGADASGTQGAAGGGGLAAPRRALPGVTQGQCWGHTRSVLGSHKEECEALCGVCQVFTGGKLTPCGGCGVAYHESCLRTVGDPHVSKFLSPPDPRKQWVCSNCRNLSNVLTEEEFSSLLKRLENCGITKDVPVMVAACLRYVVLTYESHVGADMTEDQVETEMAAFQRMAQQDSDMVAWSDLLNYEALKVLSHRNKNSLVRLLTKVETGRLRETFRQHDPEAKGKISAADAKNAIQRSLMELVNAGDKKLFQEEGRGGVITWADFVRNNAIYMLAARISLPAQVLRPSLRRRAAAPSPALGERPTSFPLSPATPTSQATPLPTSLAPPPEKPRPTRPVSTPPASPIPGLPFRPPATAVPKKTQGTQGAKKTLAEERTSKTQTNAEQSVVSAVPGSKSPYQAPVTAALRPPCKDDGSRGSGESVAERRSGESVAERRSGESVAERRAAGAVAGAGRQDTRHSLACVVALPAPHLPPIAERSARLTNHRRSDDGVPRADSRVRLKTRWSDPRLSDTGLFIKEMKEKFNRLSDGQGDATPTPKRGEFKREITPQRRRSDSGEESALASRDSGDRTAAGDDACKKHNPLGVSRSCGTSPLKENAAPRGGVQLRSPNKLTESIPSPLGPIGERLSDGHGGCLRADFLRDLTQEAGGTPRSSASRQRFRSDRSSDGSDKSQRNSGEAARYDAVRMLEPAVEPDDTNVLITDGHVFLPRSPAGTSAHVSHGAMSLVSPVHASPLSGVPAKVSPHGQRVPLRPTPPGRAAQSLRAHTRSVLLTGVKLSPPEVAPKPPQGHGKRPMSMAL